VLFAQLVLSEQSLQVHYLCCELEMTHSKISTLITGLNSGQVFTDLYPIIRTDITKFNYSNVGKLRRLLNRIMRKNAQFMSRQTI